MRLEKIFSRRGGYSLGKSDYVYLANYERITVDEIAELRTELSKHEAEFHVVKNTILDVAAKERSLPELDALP